MAQPSLAREVPAETAAPTRVAETRPSILIVDDRRENLVATEKALKHLDAAIFKASSGNEALSLMLRHSFAVVLLDVQMPEMNGFETAMLMQEHESMRNVPIIFVTAISKEEKYATQAAEIGAVDYIFKPINPDILRSKVRVYLDLYVQHEQILKLNRTLSRSNTDLEQFAYVASHDLQEPLRMVATYTELIAEHYKDSLDEKAEKYIHHAVDGAKRMQQLIKDLLAYSRVDTQGKMPTPIKSEAVMKSVLDGLKIAIEENHAEIVCDKLPPVRADSVQLAQVFQNLIGNALKFHGERVPQIHIGAERDNDKWIFRVEDSGIGIDKQHAEVVFQMFQRLHERGQYEGSGIGLAIAKKIVERHGGRIWFDSELGKGSTFYFTMPAVQGNVT
jgi:two-component system, sensor histidine kinase and response regulator